MNIDQVRTFFLEQQLQQKKKPSTKEKLFFEIYLHTKR